MRRGNLWGERGSLERLQLIMGQILQGEGQILQERILEDFQGAKSSGVRFEDFTEEI